LSKFNALDVALVVAAFGRHVLIETPEGQRLIGHPRGKKSDTVVGDRVRWQPAGDEAVIEQTEPRRNLLFRRDEVRTKSFAANLDQVLILVAGEPVFSESQLARALIAAESANIPACIVLNKCDLVQASATARARLQPYTAMGVAVVEVALKTQSQASHRALMPMFQGKTTLVLGASGMGKSTLINLMAPGADAQTAEISQALASGRHTTTSTTMYWVDAAKTTALIDSPGFQSFGLNHITATDLALLMPDLRTHAGECRFYNCTHRHEPGCGVRAALARGDVHASRYALYEQIRDELTAPQRW
jgi:ribosome biogenesis GTPase / thiamine phosphate phosphatase